MAEITRILEAIDEGDAHAAEELLPLVYDELRRLAALAAESQNDPRYRWDLGKSHGWLSFWLSLDLRLEEAARERRIALGIVQDLAAEFPSNEEYRMALAGGTAEMGRRLAGIGKFDEAEKYNRAAVTVGGQLTPLIRVSSRQHLAYLLMRLARYDEAEQVLEEALEIAEQEMAPSASPPDAGWRDTIVWIAGCHYMVGQLRFCTLSFEDAHEHLRKAIDPVARLSDDFPSANWVPNCLGWWYHDLAEVLTAMGRLEEAEKARRQSLAVWASGGTPVAATIPHGKGLAHYRLGELLHQSSRTKEAAHQFTDALAVMEDLSQRRPDESVCHWQLICLLANCPDPEFRDPGRAVALAKHVLPPRAGHYWRYLALAQYRSGDWQDAADSIRHAMDLRQGGDACDWLLLAMADWQLGQKKEAIKTYTEAQEAIKAGKPIFYEYLGVMAVDRLRREAAMLLGERTGDTEEEE